MAAAACEWGRASPWSWQFASNQMHSQSWKRQGNLVQSPALLHAETWSEPSKSTQLISVRGFPGGSAVKNPLADAGDAGLVPGSGRSFGVGNSNPFQYPGLGDPMDYTVHGILQARILEWVAFLFSRGSSKPRDWTQVSRIAGRFPQLALKASLWFHCSVSASILLWNWFDSSQQSRGYVRMIGWPE